MLPNIKEFESDIMTIQQVAKYIKMTTITIYKLAQSGIIPAFKIGSDWRIRKQYLDQWLDLQSNPVRKMLTITERGAPWDTFKSYLTENGYGLVSVGPKSEEIRERLGESVYNLVFLDLEIQKKETVGIYKEIREKNPNLKIVILTKNPKDPFLNQILELGPATVILKPIKFSHLSQLLEDMSLTKKKTVTIRGRVIIPRRRTAKESKK